MNLTKPDLSQVKKAYFQQYTNGKRVLKIWVYRDPEIIDIDSYNPQRTIYREVVEYCLSLGFQDDTYPIDNRTESELFKDWEKSIERSYLYETTPPGTFEEWKSRLELSF